METTNPDFSKVERERERERERKDVEKSGPCGPGL